MSEPIREYWDGKLSEPVKMTCNLGFKWLPKDYDVLKSFNAEHWAASFLDTLRDNPDIIIDHELMKCWFANSLMRGYDEHYWRTAEYKRKVRRALVPWWKRWFVPLTRFGR